MNSATITTVPQAIDELTEEIERIEGIRNFGNVDRKPMSPFANTLFQIGQYSPDESNQIF